MRVSDAPWRSWRGSRRKASPERTRSARMSCTGRCAPAGSARVELPLPGLYNVYNALGAAALCLQLGAGLVAIVAGLQAVAPAFGRAETVQLSGRPTSILLVKNPAHRLDADRTRGLLQRALRGQAAPAPAAPQGAPPADP